MMIKEILSLVLAILFFAVITDAFTSLLPPTVTPSMVTASIRKTSTQQNQEAADGNNDNDSYDNSSSMFMTSLNNRLKEVKEQETKLPLVVLDSMLPRQVLELEVNNALLIELIRDCFSRESPYIGMCGIARLQSGQHVHLTKGVEVEIVEDKLQYLTAEGKGGVKMAFKATGRRFEIEKGKVDTVGGDGDRGWTEAKVKFLDSRKEEEEEIKSNEHDNYDRMGVARAISKAEEFTIPNMNMPNNVSLVDRWIQLARKKERSPGQIDNLLKDIGDIPPSDQPTERSLWIGALINPLPAMGVALEIRPALLTADKAEKRVEVALNGILRSIKYMDDS